MNAYPQRSKGLFLASITALCWAVLALGLKQALTFTDSGSIVAFRMLISFVFLFIYFLIFKTSEISKIKSGLPYSALIAGLMLSFNYYGFMKGVEHTGAGNAQIMIQLGPALLILSGLLFFKERFHKYQILGFIVAIIGFILFYTDQKKFDSLQTLNLGNLWIIGAALTWAVYASLQKKLIPKWDPQTLNLIIYCVCALVLFSLCDFKQSLSFSLSEWVLMIFLGLNTVVAYGCFAESLKFAPASEVSLIITVNPLGTLLLLQLGKALNISWMPVENLSFLGVLGAVCVVSGVGWTLAQKKS